MSSAENFLSAKTFRVVVVVRVCVCWGIRYTWQIFFISASGDNFFDFLFEFTACQSPSEKGSTLEGKTLLQQ